jgi:hypothetical protein
MRMRRSRTLVDDHRGELAPADAWHVTSERLTLHRRVWRRYRRLPRPARVLFVIAIAAAMLDFAVLSGSGREHAVRAAVAGAVRAATGPDPASSCSALSPAGLRQLVSEVGDATSAQADPLQACRQLVPRLRSQATPQQLADLAGGSVRTIQFRSDGSALVVYLAADHRLGAQLTLSERGGRWLIDSVAAGALAGS